MGVVFGKNTEHVCNTVRLWDFLHHGRMSKSLDHCNIDHTNQIQVNPIPDINTDLCDNFPDAKPTVAKQWKNAVTDKTLIAVFTLLSALPLHRWNKFPSFSSIAIQEFSQNLFPRTTYITMLYTPFFRIQSVHKPWGHGHSGWPESPTSVSASAYHTSTSECSLSTRH